MLSRLLFVGLCNPGAEYAATRHNAGAWLVQGIADNLHINLRRDPRFYGLVGTTDRQVFLLPDTYMNKSGQAVATLARFYHIPAHQILVAQDELDLLPGTVRLKFGGGAGGHNGPKDIITQLGTQDFWRLRIGIGHPGNRNQVSDYVLKAPPLSEKNLIEEALDRAAEVWSLIAEGRMDEAMKQLNQRVSLKK